MSELIARIVAESIEVKRRFFTESGREIERAGRVIAEVIRSGCKILLCGNGGSAADAQHIAGEFVNRFICADRRALPALALSTDGSILTCIANDTAFDRVFARQIEAFGAPGDVLIAISTSGDSPNVIAAALQARMQEMKIIGFLGRDGGRMASLCDIALIVPSANTQRIQETHNLLGHILCEMVERQLFPEQFS
ncbi:D-sedoheptulose-7-phosphate isomerase [Pyrinomonas methylaliphatogenes]|jgi:D-sedoheptulose 7-phosphate isomerase|uniref:Phosphoheptose isomerase n=1 Tax=Pyrinomonas methylaliphatogenes TaxID=454194 RepID=A0A0B6X100_9BACT|nr:D-sedoheptulose 7-phosphate isomerase [Pyrinomonas methylaliphatogenes]CDM66234.1 phosphoheptose isomerase [Pyrinomonas methylaliphatogenes]